jgi:LasA protease
MRKPYAAYCGLICVAFIIGACSFSTTRSQPIVVMVTATPIPLAETMAPLPTDDIPTESPTDTPSPVQMAAMPSPNPPRFTIDGNRASSHTVQSGDTLYGIAAAYGTSLEALLAANEFLDPNRLSVGETVLLPETPTQFTPDFKILPDVLFVRGPGSAEFDTLAFVNQHDGYLRRVLDRVDARLADGSHRPELLTGAQVIERVSIEYSIDPRLLLAILDYSAGWISDPNPSDELRDYPFPIDREGFYRQMSWVANQLNMAYYGWRYRGWTTLELTPTQRFFYAEGLNAATVALQYGLSLILPPEQWLSAVTLGGFFQHYFAYFGNPFESNVIDPIAPSDLTQPPMILPFARGEVWFFTGGAHGGWGSGSAWSALDFAPPDIPPNGVFCYTSDYWVRAVASGIIARSGDGSVVLDLDFDGDESTGWTVLYLHIATQDRIPAGTVVQEGDPIGRASCEGGFSTATHLHIARRYNGEWIPADCFVCSPFEMRPAFNLGGWRVIGLRNQEYQGHLEQNGERRTAEQSRLTAVNRVSW